VGLNVEGYVRGRRWWWLPTRRRGVHGRGDGGEVAPRGTEVTYVIITKGDKGSEDRR